MQSEACVANATTGRGLCVVCGVNHQNRRKTCSTECRKELRRRTNLAMRRPDRICQHCGKAYHPKAIDRVSFCSRECSYADMHKKSSARRERIELRRQKRAAMIAERKRRAADGIASCLWCGIEFFKSHPTQKHCSDKCRKRYIKRGTRLWSAKHFGGFYVFACKECGKEWATCHRRRSFCDESCLRKYNNRYRRAAVEAWERSAKHEYFGPMEIYERDGWVCGICGWPVDREAKVPAFLAPTIDHILPKSKGGDHTRANVRCAHFICNARRGNADDPRAAVVA